MTSWHGTVIALRGGSSTGAGGKYFGEFRQPWSPVTSRLDRVAGGLAVAVVPPAVLSGMRLRIDRFVSGGDDRAGHFQTVDGDVLVVADGAGGIGDGAHAAASVIAAVAADLALADALACAALLNRVDATLRRGETTAVLVAVAGDEIRGASVGDSSAWLVDAHGLRDLCENQHRKPLIGSGRAVPVPFSARLGPATLLLASDGLFNYAARARITELAATAALEGLASRLADLARLRSGAFPDDISVLVARA